jgi:hypothetical protein
MTRPVTAQAFDISVVSYSFFCKVGRFNVSKQPTGDDALFPSETFDIGKRSQQLKALGLCTRQDAALFNPFSEYPQLAPSHQSNRL